MKKPCAVLLSIIVALTTQAHTQEIVPLRLIQTIPLPGVEGRIDHLAVDLQRGRLFVAALGNNTLEVLDLRAGKRIQSISGLREPQGVCFIPESNRIWVANGQDGTCDIFDGDTFHLVHSVRLSGDADNLRYDAVAGHVFVGYGDGSLGVLDATAGRLLGSIPLAGHPEAFQLEMSGPHIFINVPTADQIAVVNRANNTLTAVWPLADARANFPMTLDEANHRLFVGCRKPPRLLVYDTGSGKMVAGLNIAGDTDDLFYDAAQTRLYASGGEGFLEVFQRQSADQYAAVAKLPTAPGARTSLFDPGQRRLYLAVPHRADQQAEIRVYEAQR